jgi:hypothetical protein
MRKLITMSVSAALVVAMAGMASAGKPPACTTIGAGVLQDSYGNTLVLGYDQFGYNYQAHMFNGTYDSSDRVLDGKYFGSTGDYVDDQLSMKWSEDWLSNKDCTGDGKLDRGGSSGISKGWTTNHVNGDYVTGSGEQHYTYFVKIGYVGPGGGLWTFYDVLQENYQDPTGMSHWHAASPGLGQNDHWTVG